MSGEERLVTRSHASRYSALIQRVSCSRQGDWGSFDSAVAVIACHSLYCSQNQLPATVAVFSQSTRRQSD